MLRGKFCSNKKENIDKLIEKGFSLDESFKENNFCDFISINEKGNIILISPDEEYYLNKKNKISEEEFSNSKICCLSNLDKEELIKMYLSKSEDLKNLAFETQEMHRTLMTDLQNKFDNYKKTVFCKPFGC